MASIDLLRDRNMNDRQFWRRAHVENQHMESIRPAKPLYEDPNADLDLLLDQNMNDRQFWRRAYVENQHMASMRPANPSYEYRLKTLAMLIHLQQERIQIIQEKNRRIAQQSYKQSISEDMYFLDEDDPDDYYFWVTFKQERIQKYTKVLDNLTKKLQNYNREYQDLLIQALSTREHARNLSFLL